MLGDVSYVWLRSLHPLAPPSVGYFVLIAERAKRAEPTTETPAVARTGGERHTPTFVAIGDRVNTRERGSLANILPRPCFQTVERIRDALTRGKSGLQNRKIILCNASTP